MPGNGPITFTGKLDFTFGPDESISLPGWLGGTFNADLADLDLTASISSQALSGTGDLTVAGGLATATVTAAKYDFGSGEFTASGDLDIGGIFTGNSSLAVNNGEYR